MRKEGTLNGSLRCRQVETATGEHIPGELTYDMEHCSHKAMFNSKSLKFLVWLLCSIFTPLGMAQSISGDLVVKVSDSSNAVVAGARLILTATDTNVKNESITDKEGTTLFPQLKPGRYQLEASHAGFQTQAVKDIRIQVGQRARVDIEMKIGQVTEAVTISAAAETLLNRESAAIGIVTFCQSPRTGRLYS